MMAGLEAEFPGQFLLCRSSAVPRLMSMVRAKPDGEAETRRRFIRYSDRAIHLLVEEALAALPHKDLTVHAAGGLYQGQTLLNGEEGEGMCGVRSISFVWLW